MAIPMTSVLSALLLTVALATPRRPACTDGDIASPNTSWAACFSLPKQRATSLRQCVEMCEKLGMVPMCIGSAEENAFAAQLVPSGDWAYFGLVQNDTNGGPAEGWGRCVAGDASGFTHWDTEHAVVAQPNDGLGPQDCAVTTRQGLWHDMCASCPFLARHAMCVYP